MANLQVRFGFSYDLNRLNLSAVKTGFVAAAAPSAYLVDYGGGTNDLFLGYSFTYDFSKLPTGGVLTSY